MKFNKKTLVLIFLLIIAFSNDYFINPIIHPSESIELKLKDVNSPADRILDLNYLFAHGFNDVHIQNDRYRRIANDVIYIESSTQENKPRYIVTQSLIKGVWEHFKLKTILAKVKISIFDRKSGKVILSWAVPRSGWPGDKTSKKLAELMQISKKDDLKKVLKSTNSTSEIIVSKALRELSSIELEELYKENTCTDKLKVTSNKLIDSHSMLVASEWRFRLPRNFRGITCNQNVIFISSAWQPEDLYLIWLDNEGTFKLSSYVTAKRTKLGGGYYPSKLLSVEFNDNKLLAHRVFFKNIDGQNLWVIDKEIKYTIPIKNSLL
jgi:hypothetical protein